MGTQNSNLQRWLTGLVLAAVLLLIIVMGSPVVLTAVITLVIVIGLWEYNGIVFGPGHRAEKTESMIIAVLIPWIVLAGSTQWIAAVLTFAILMAVSYTHLRAHETVLDLVCRLLLEKTKSIRSQHTSTTALHLTTIHNITS